MVGPFIFFDHMGPADFPPGKGISVRPHPHIGLATVTYLFEGEIIHRDSLGIVQPIQPGAVNLMTAGRGIVHSERSGDDLDRHARVHGIQSWMALPLEDEDCAPDFRHYAADSLPQFDVDGCAVTVIIGEAYGRHSPVGSYSPILYLDCRLPAGRSLTLPTDQEELALYVIDGTVRADSAGAVEDLPAYTMLVADDGAEISVRADADCHFMVIGGAPLGERHLWWNFVASSREKIEQAKQEWRNGGFDRVPGDEEFIPLPD